jgi:hypothetical protein
MKKTLTYAFVLVLASCHSNTPAEQDEAQRLLDSVNTTKKENTIITSAASNATPQLTATFKGQTLNMVGKITTQCNTNNDCNSTIMVKQKNADGDNMYELVAVLNNKIAVGTFQLTSNFFGNFIDAVNTITKGEGDTKYNAPTGYKQKGGSITFTTVTDKVVSGSFSFNIYKLSDTTVTETIQGTIKDLPIKVLGE